MGRHQQPHQKQTYTNKQSGSKLEGEEEGGGGRGGGDTVQKWNVFMFSCPTNGSYFPPLSSIWADIAHDTVAAVKRAFSKRSLDGQFFLFLQQTRHGLCLYRDGRQQLMVRSLK